MFGFFKGGKTEASNLDLFFMVTGQYWAFYKRFGMNAVYDPEAAAKFFSESLSIDKMTVSPQKAREVVEFFTLTALSAGEFPAKLKKFKELNPDPNSNSWKTAMLEVSDEMRKKGLTLL